MRVFIAYVTNYNGCVAAENETRYDIGVFSSKTDARLAAEVVAAHLRAIDVSGDSFAYCGRPWEVYVKGYDINPDPQACADHAAKWLF